MRMESAKTVFTSKNKQKKIPNVRNPPNFYHSMRMESAENRTMTKKIKISPCPVCGEKPTIERQKDHYALYCNGGEHCLCAEARKTKKEAIALWNKLVSRRPNIILVHYDTRRDGNDFESFYTLEAAHKAIANFIKENGGEAEWSQRNEIVWECGNGEDFINIVELTVKE